MSNNESGYVYILINFYIMGKYCMKLKKKKKYHIFLVNNNSFDAIFTKK